MRNGYRGATYQVAWQRRREVAMEETFMRSLLPVEILEIALEHIANGPVHGSTTCVLPAGPPNASGWVGGECHELGIL